MRFEKIVENPDYPVEDTTCWFWDTERKVKEPSDQQTFIAVQCYVYQDPNSFIRIPPEKFNILYTDQAEYYFVCFNCYLAFSHMQWSGSTRMSGWRETSQRQKEKHAKEKGWCEFCDPVFGNGGWLSN